MTKGELKRHTYKRSHPFEVLRPFFPSIAKVHLLFLESSATVPFTIRPCSIKISKNNSN